MNAFYDFHIILTDAVAGDEPALASRLEFDLHVPYVVAVVSLDEGFRMIANVEPVSDVEVGRRCHVVFRPSPATEKPAPFFVLDDR